MKKLLPISSLAATTMLLTNCQKPQPTAQESQKNTATKPNIVFIYADDLGYGDLSCFGADSIQTPNLDKLAANGVQLNCLYSSSPICSPSRAALLTGRYHVRSGITEVFFPNSLEGIDSDELLLPELLKSHGYATGLVGKWHLGHKPKYLPHRNGFDYFFGLPYSNDMQWEPRKDPPLPLMRYDKVIDAPVYQKTLTQRYACEAINFIARNQNKPFFLYMAHSFPHKPRHVSAEYAGTSTYGLYGDVVQEIDKSVGDVMEALDYYGLTENTIVVFSSDNGATPDVSPTSNGGLRGFKATTFEGGIRVPGIITYPKVLPASKQINQPLIMMDWFPTLAAFAQIPLPDSVALDGQNIAPVLMGDLTHRPTEEFYFYWKDTISAIRISNYKLKLPYAGNPRKGLPAHDTLLFDLKKDPTESNNLYRKLPDIVNKIVAKKDSFERAMGTPKVPKLKSVPFDDPRKK